MFTFILNIVFMLSLGTILYIVARALPRVEEEAEKSDRRKGGLLERWVTSEMPEKVDEFLSTFLSKLLRKFKVFLLKIDNSRGAHLKKNKPDSSRGEGNGGGFKDMAEEVKEE